MNVHLIGAATLAGFTRVIQSGFLECGLATSLTEPADLTLIQIHGAPASKAEDRRILEQRSALNQTTALLVHRPDEVLLDPILKSYFETHPLAKLIVLGDLIFRDQFWAERRARTTVIPHPQLDISAPTGAAKRVVGAFTTWGEMRNINHYLELVERLRASDQFLFWVGGSGLKRESLPAHVELREDSFVPHFNVQLYHLNGRKRYGESSGSLHRGVSVPVIFEANGAEHLEGFRAVKVEADDDLRNINYEKAAREILDLNANRFESVMANNRRVALKNSPAGFARAVVASMRGMDETKTV